MSWWPWGWEDLCKLPLRRLPPKEAEFCGLFFFFCLTVGLYIQGFVEECEKDGLKVATAFDGVWVVLAAEWWKQLQLLAHSLDLLGLGAVVVGGQGWDGCLDQILGKPRTLCVNGQSGKRCVCWGGTAEPQLGCSGAAPG